MEITRQNDSEKLTLNLGYVDLGKIDLLVREGFYANRSDFIRTAIRNQLRLQAADVDRSVTRNTFDLGLREFTRRELEQHHARQETISIRVVGLARIAADVSPELAAATIGSITVLGALQANDDIKAALAGKLKSP
ncbi:CopG family transcriptional regulator [Aestuariivirga sp.]|uniref:CopG family transcriptional regulator n=1 Tax=Aestuariivirga sp. TaxID=2650926 RepID=UPI00391AFBB1